jgi:hypothetical protein
MSVRVPAGPPQPQGVSEDPLTQYTRVFTKFLQLVFASFTKGNYKWSADYETTDIIIQGEGTMALDVVEKRPAIVVSRGPVAFTNIALDQFAGPLLDVKTGRITLNYDPATSARRHTDLLSSVMTFNCLAAEGLEAQRLAWIAAYAVRTLKRSLMQVGMHRVGEDIQVGGESAPGAIVQPDTTEIILVSVSVPFFFQQTWTVQPEDKTLLNQVSIALRSEVGLPETVQPVIRGPGMNGQLLRDTQSVRIDEIPGPVTGP